MIITHVSTMCHYLLIFGQETQNPIFWRLLVTDTLSGKLFLFCLNTKRAVSVIKLFRNKMYAIESKPSLCKLITSFDKSDCKTLKVPCHLAVYDIIMIHPTEATGRGQGYIGMCIFMVPCLSERMYK